MNTKTTSMKWSWIQLNERRAAQTGMLFLLLLLALPGVVQAQFTYTINNGTVTITQFAISQHFSLLTVQVGGLPMENHNPDCL